jgi:signal peptidase I
MSTVLSDPETQVPYSAQVAQTVQESEPVEATETESPKRRRPLAVVGSILIFLVALVILWPAQFGGFTGLTVVNGHSMQPTYYTGDLVVTLRLPSYQPNDIISFKVPQGQPGAGGRVIHRVFSDTSVKGQTVYTTKGDNNPSVDPWHPGNADILGKALFSIPAIGSVLGGASNPIVVGLVAGILVTLLVWRIGSGPKKRRHRGAH